MAAANARCSARRSGRGDLGIRHLLPKRTGADSLDYPADRGMNRFGVLQVVLTLDVGGTERLVVEICRRLHPLISMSVCTLDQPGVWADELRSRGVNVVSLERPPGFHPGLGVAIARAARRSGAALIHCHHYSPFVYGSLATLLRPNVPMLFTEHGRLSDGPPSRKRQIVNPILARVPRAIYAVSSALRDSMVAEGFPGKRVHVIHNGIDPGLLPNADDRQNARTRLGFRDGDLLVGTVARLDAVKDLGTLIEAAALLRRTRRDLTLVIVGDGPERGSLEDLSRRHDLADAVRFLGHRDDARQLLPAFDVYVNSSISEGISLTILEAMAARLPVVATKVGGTPEIIQHNVTGLLVPARSPSSIAWAVATLQNPRRRGLIGAAARLEVEQRFTIERMVDRYADVYCRLAS